MNNNIDTVINSVAEEDVGTMLPNVGLNGKPVEDDSIEHEEDTEEIKKDIFETSDIVDEEKELECVEAMIDLLELDDYQEIVTESTFMEEEDIFYNQAKYENGDINILFITGYSGSGKSTMSHGEKKILREVVDMDRIVLFTNKSDEYYTKMGPFAKAFMVDGPGKKYREPEDKEFLLKNASERFRKDISRDLVKFAKQYAKENKRKKLVLEGVWIYRYIEPSEVNDCAVYIKGTSLKTSTDRAISRDLKHMEKEGKGNIISKSRHAVMKTFMASRDVLLRPLEKYQKYFGDKYKKQKHEIIKYGKKVKNSTKGMIHDLAGKIKDMTESEDDLILDIEFSEAVLDYMNDPSLVYDSLVEEGVGNVITKIKERVVVSGDVCKLIVDIYMLKKRIKKSSKTDNTKLTIDLKRELVQKQKELSDVKRTASPELQKEISKIEKNLEKNTAKFDIEDIKTESADCKIVTDELFIEDANTVSISYNEYAKIREEEIAYMKKFKTVLQDYTDSQKTLNTAVKKGNTTEIKNCADKAVQKLNNLESTVKNAPKITDRTADICSKALKAGLITLAAKIVHDKVVCPVAYKAGTSKMYADYEKEQTKLLNKDYSEKDLEALDKFQKDFTKKVNNRYKTINALDTAAVAIGVGAAAYANGKKDNSEIKFKDCSEKFKQDQLKFIEKNRKQLEKIISMDFSVKKETDETLIEGEEIMESLYELHDQLDNEFFIEKEEKTLPPELKRLDEIRGQIENLSDDLASAKEKLSETGEKLYENKVKGLTAKIDKLKKELAEKEKESEKILGKNVEESTEFVSEAHTVTLDGRINYWTQMVEGVKQKINDKLIILKKTTLAGEIKKLQSEIATLKTKLKTYQYNLNELLEEKKNLKAKVTYASTDDIVYDDVLTEAADMEDEIKPIVDKLNSKGYKVKYASPGHKKLRKKEDAQPDGVYYGKLYSDARVMFDEKYSFPNAPKYWHWREVEGCSYLDITPITYNKEDGTPDEAFAKWKENYMNSLKSFVDDLKGNTSEREVKESVNDFTNSLMEEIFEKMGINDLDATALYVNESVDIKEEKTTNLLEELDNLLS